MLDDAVDGVLAYARQGSGPLVLLVAVVNGIAEELFFRGALYAAVPARAAVLVTTAVYTTASMASGNLMLGFAALVLGTLVGMERRASGGVLGPHPHPRHLVDLDAARAAGALRLSDQCHSGCLPHQLDVPGPPLNGPVTLSVIQPP